MGEISFDSTVSGRCSLPNISAGCFYPLKSIFSSLFGVTVVRLSLLVKAKTSAECFCSKNYILYSLFTHTWVFSCLPDYLDCGTSSSFTMFIFISGT